MELLLSDLVNFQTYHIQISTTSSRTSPVLSIVLLVSKSNQLTPTEIKRDRAFREKETELSEHKNYVFAFQRFMRIFVATRKG